jgi:transcriptional regulator with XRE-family HTH domain
MIMGDSPNPLVPPRRRLRAEIRGWRQEAGLTQEEVAKAMDWSLSKVIRIEAGSVGISTNDLRALLRLYKISDPDRIGDLIALARLARERSWWSTHRDILPPQLIQFIEYEAAASVNRGFQPLLIPGLLQTKDYARAVIHQLANAATREEQPERLDSMLEVRMKRQELLDRVDPPTLHFILDEAVIRRSVGGKVVMRGQIHHLIEVSARQNLTVQVVPFSAGVHPGMQGSFVILQFPDPADDDVLYLEGARGDLIIRDMPEDVAAHEDMFDKLRRLSLGPAESVSYLGKVADDMT